MSKSKRSSPRRGESALRAAAERLLNALHDDHEDCPLCDANEYEAHNSDASCGNLQAAL